MPCCAHSEHIARVSIFSPPFAAVYGAIVSRASSLITEQTLTILPPPPPPTARSPPPAHPPPPEPARSPAPARASTPSRAPSDPPARKDSPRDHGQHDVRRVAVGVQHRLVRHLHPRARPHVLARVE